MTSEPFARFFGFSLAPFSKEIEDGDLWLPPSKEETVDEICEAAHEHSQVMLVGEPGAGKICVLRVVRHRLPQAGFRLTYCHNATLGRRDFYRQLCHALGLTPAATAAGVFYAVSSHVEYLGRERIHPVFLLDEAHNRAGADRDVFTSDALSLLHEAAGSSLREIDRIATATLREAARRKKKLVERDVMAKIVGDTQSISA